MTAPLGDASPVDRGSNDAAQPSSPAPSREHAGGPRRRRLARLLDAALATVLLVVVGATFRAAVAEVYVVEGGSMEPTLEAGERLLVVKLTTGPTPGDIAVFEHPFDEGARIVKRVLALPGQRVRVEGGVLYRDGVRIAEPYVPDAERAWTDDLPEMTVPAGFYFVLGDHRSGSLDSRIFGAIPADHLVGRAALVVWPPGRARRLP